MAKWEIHHLKMCFLLRMGIFQQAMSVSRSVLEKNTPLPFKKRRCGHQESTSSHPVISVEISCPWFVSEPSSQHSRGRVVGVEFTRDFASTKFQVSSLLLSSFGCFIFYVAFSFERAENSMFIYNFICYTLRGCFAIEGFFLGTEAHQLS